MGVVDTALVLAIILIVGSYLFIRCTASTYRVLNGDRTLEAMAWAAIGVALMSVGIGNGLVKIFIWLKF